MTVTTRLPRLVSWAGLVFVMGCSDAGRDDDPFEGASSPTMTTVPADGVDATTDPDVDEDENEDAEDSGGSVKLDVGPGATTSVDPDSDGPNVCDQDIDIVFVMDVSTSMETFLETLANEVLVVDQALAELELPSAPQYGLVVFVDDIALLGAGAPYPDATALRADFQEWSEFTSSNAQVSGSGSNTTWPENSLDALYAAATGFQWRPADSTLRIVIHTTDDTFVEGPTTFDGVDIEHGYADTVQALQDQQIRVFSFTADLGGSCSCEDVTPGWSGPYLGQPSVPDATDGGRFDIDMVLTNAISLSEAINASVEGAVCEDYEPVG